MARSGGNSASTVQYINSSAPSNSRIHTQRTGPVSQLVTNEWPRQSIDFVLHIPRNVGQHLIQLQIASFSTCGVGVVLSVVPSFAFADKVWWNVSSDLTRLDTTTINSRREMKKKNWSNVSQFENIAGTNRSSAEFVSVWPGSTNERHENALWKLCRSKCGFCLIQVFRGFLVLFAFSIMPTAAAGKVVLPNVRLCHLCPRVFSSVTVRNRPCAQISRMLFRSSWR